MMAILINTTLLIICGLAIDLYPIFTRATKIKNILIPTHTEPKRKKPVSKFVKDTLWLHVPTLRNKLKQAGLDHIAYHQYIKLCLLSLSCVFLLCIFLLLKLNLFNLAPKLQYAFMGIITLSSFLIPRVIIEKMRKKRVEIIDYYMSPFIDLILVCLDSGLTFHQSFKNVTKEIGLSCPLIEVEFSKTVKALQVSLNPGVILTELHNRLPSDALGSFVATVTQSLEKGSSLYDALHQLSIISYQENLLELEKKVEKLPMIVTTLAGFILLPAFLITAIAPLFNSLKGTIFQ